jgi:hypothetical protein
MKSFYACYAIFTVIFFVLFASASDSGMTILLLIGFFLSSLGAIIARNLISKLKWKLAASLLFSLMGLAFAACLGLFLSFF